MANDDSGEEKPFDPTPRKLEEARRRGDVPISQDLVTSGMYLGVLVAFAVGGSAAVERGGVLLRVFVERPDAISQWAFTGATSFVGQVLLEIGPALAYLFLIPMAAALAAVWVQNAMVVSADRIKPKLNRISPVSLAKQKYGRVGLFNFAKSFAKLTVYCLLLAWIGARWATDILATPSVPFEKSVLLAVDVTFGFLAAACCATMVIGAVDFLWQRAEHLRKNRMSLKELRDESKESEGDPHTKQARRQKAYDIATNRMLQDVPGADVVIVNPTHYAVALKWARTRGTAPTCVAKGTDAVAARIRETAAEAGVPIHSDPPTARALFAAVEIGSEIRPEHYRPVAAAIRFADALRRRRGGRPE